MSQESVTLPQGPQSVERLLAFIRRVVALPKLQEVKITPLGITVLREGDLGIPEGLRAVLEGENGEFDLEFLLSRLSLEVLEPAQQEHQLTALIQGFAKLRMKDLVVVAVVAPPGDELDAYLGNPEGTHPKYLFGVPVHYDSAVEQGCLVLFGSPTGHLFEANAAVLIDMGAVT